MVYSRQTLQFHKWLIMLYIAHRGNINGPSLALQNTPQYIQVALDLGFHVEIDLWGRDGTLWLGHDAPENLISHHYIIEHQERFFCHCKNVEAIDILNEHVPSAHYFFHDSDDYTITSRGFLWCYPSKKPARQNSIIVMPERYADGIAYYLAKHKPFGVCSDYVNDLIL